jgi:NitT/TauT family transport system permease protein
MDRLVRWVAPVVVFVVALLAWEWLVIRFEVPVWIVPAPSRIGATLAKDWSLLISALGVTLRIALEALAAATFLGVGIAFVFVQSRALEASLLPYVILLQVTPVVAIAPLIIIWVDDPEAALVICATIVALFPMISNTTTGLKSVDAGLLDLFRLHRASRWQVLMRLRVPSALPYFFSGLKVSAGLALIGAVVAEFVAGTGGTASGLAYQILQAGLQLNFPRMFAALLLIAIAGVSFFAATSGLAWLFLRKWHAGAGGR